MKKIVVSVISTVMIFGVGTIVLATNNDTNEDITTFEKMKPLMEKMHPDLSNEEQKEMYELCHGENGKMKNRHMKNMDHMENMDHMNMMNKF